MIDENMLPCSVIATAGILSSTARSSISSMRQAPSSSEYSEWRWRWTKSDIEGTRSRGSSDPAIPLDRRRRLRTDVVDHAVDTLDLVHDARGDRGEDLVRQPGPVGGHAVTAFNRPDRNRVFVGARVTHHAHALHRQQHGKRLP